MTTPTGFAEMFEWDDSNPNNEDRAGCTVALCNGDKIKIAQPGDTPIGVIGGDNTSVSAISGASPDEWHGKHLRGKFGRLLWEDQVMVEWIADLYRHWYEADRIPAGTVVPEDATYYRGTWNGHNLRREILSEEYKNPQVPVSAYLPRWDRPEWGIVILVGRAVIKEGSVCDVRWQKLQREDTTISGISEWLIR